MAAPAELRIVPAPPALKEEIISRVEATFATHREHQPFAFPANLSTVAVRPAIDFSFTRNGWGVKESPNIFAAYLGETFTGYIQLSTWADDDPQLERYVSVDDIFILQEYRGRGLGAALLAHVKDMARARGWGNLTATVWAWNAASAGLFEREGFVEQSTTYRFGPEGPARDIVAPPGLGWRIHATDFLLKVLAIVGGGAVMLLIIRSLLSP